VKFDLKSGDICSNKCDAIIVNLFEGQAKPGGATGAVDKAMGGAISGLIKAGEIKGKYEEAHVIHSLGKIPARLVVIAGLGKKEDLTVDRVLNIMGDVVRVLRAHHCKTAASILHGAGAGGLQPADAAEAITEGSLLGAYHFRQHKTKKEEEHDINQLTIVEADSSRFPAVKKGMERGRVIAEATMLARDMVNQPANYMTPSHMADIAGGIAEKYKLEITVWDREQMEKKAMGAFLGVAQGTKERPKFIIISYKGNPSRTDTVGFVGKGLTFDSGGISLKPQEFMSDMKGDMAGGADVIAAIGAVAALKLRINVTAIIPATENLPGGRALKPGDVLKASNGKTIEVVNTDAEGRLLLADALSYAVSKKISPLIDLATLTGACHVALGDMYAGVFSNNQALADKVLQAGKDAGELLWQLPLSEEYKELNKSDVADIKNSGGRYGGAITAALFLQEFAGEKPWVHIDIAGPFMSEKNKGVLVKGATGFGVRTLIHLAIALSK
jgi:leucyl aminopeptidase